MKIRAKLKVDSVVKETWGGETVSLSAVTAEADPKSEDNTYAKATPSANLKMCVDNPNAHGVFVEGRCFYVDFTPIAVPVAPPENPAVPASKPV